MGFIGNLFSSVFYSISASTLLYQQAMQMIPVTAEALMVDKKRIAERFKGIKRINVPTFNAHIAIDKIGRFEIAINEGYIKYVSLMLKLFCSRMAPEGDTKLGAPPKDLTLIAISLFRSYWNSNDIMLYKGNIETIILNKLQNELLGRLYLDIQLYAIAHEFAHFIIKHYPQGAILPDFSNNVSRVNNAFSLLLNGNQAHPLFDDPEIVNSRVPSSQLRYFVF